MNRIEVNGAIMLAGYLNPEAQLSLVEELRRVVEQAPFRQYETRFGKKLSVRMSAAGEFGWVSDQRGYRYERTQPDGAPWPAIPQALLKLWDEVTECARTPQCCLVNYYGEATRMGLHQDNDEADFTCPVLSVSLGDEALFRVGGTDRKAPTKSVWLKSGDVVLLTGMSRLAYHGIDRIRFGSSSLLPKGGRINVTLRVVD